MSGIASYLVFFLCVVLILGIVTMGLNLQWGATGLFNAGVAGFYAIGGYTHAILTAMPLPGHLGNFGWHWSIGLLAAPLVTALAAWGIGALTIRLRGDYLAITSFGIAVTIQLTTLNWAELTGGPNGLTRLGRPLASVFTTPASFNLAYLALLAGVAALVYWGLERMLRAPWGRVLRAIREDETAATAIGKRAFAFRLQSLVIGCMIMGLGGALYAHFVGYIAPEDFLPILTFQLWAMLIVGGAGNNKGAILGALAVWAIWTISGGALRMIIPADQQARGAALQIVLIGALLAAMLLVRPRGLLGEEMRVSRHAARDKT